MDTPRKTPRTDAAVSKHSFLDGSRELNPDITPFIRTLEIETQELAEAVELLLDLSEGTDDFTGWRKAQARHTLAAHKAKQPE